MRDNFLCCEPPLGLIALISVQHAECNLFFSGKEHDVILGCSCYFIFFPLYNVEAPSQNADVWSQVWLKNHLNKLSFFHTHQTHSSTLK